MRILKFIWVLIFFLSCTNNSTDQSDTQLDSTISTDVTPPAFDKESPEFQTLIWSTDFDSTKRDFVLKQHRKINADTLVAEKLIKQLNSNWPDVTIVLNKISHDTIYVSIPNSFYLTQSMGSTGAGNYISSTTYNLTELKGIKYVNFDFEEGDHYAPGTFTREDFR